MVFDCKAFAYLYANVIYEYVWGEKEKKTIICGVQFVLLFALVLVLKLEVQLTNLNQPVINI